MNIILKSKHCIALIIIIFFTGPRSTPDNQLSPSISGEAQGTGQAARLARDVEEARTSAQTKAIEAQRWKENFERIQALVCLLRT
ncbi:hypothetical protein DPMN_193531 [Dreissena polymorpha]|uniref:Uncharacterized protein n=1 Tax=Dreissena polymorpha TaxID=45954 RepID=A0A9D3XXT8_DREPO|nr:hypothetical protein DPMN_193531 [Dreissena polymorpha]